MLALPSVPMLLPVGRDVKLDDAAEIPCLVHKPFIIPFQLSAVDICLNREFC